MRKLLVTLMGMGTTLFLLGCTGLGATSLLTGLGGQLATTLGGLLLSQLISGGTAPTTTTG